MLSAVVAAPLPITATLWSDKAAGSKDEKKEANKMIETAENYFRRCNHLPKTLLANKEKYENNCVPRHCLTCLQKKPTAKAQKEIDKLNKLISEENLKIEDFRNNRIFQNSMRGGWSSPALDADGQFVGFDCVIGNPPYMNIQASPKPSQNVRTIMSKPIKRWRRATTTLQSLLQAGH